MSYTLPNIMSETMSEWGGGSLFSAEGMLYRYCIGGGTSDCSTSDYRGWDYCFKTHLK